MKNIILKMENKIKDLIISNKKSTIIVVIVLSFFIAILLSYKTPLSNYLKKEDNNLIKANTIVDIDSGKTIKEASENLKEQKLSDITDIISDKNQKATEGVKKVLSLKDLKEIELYTTKKESINDKLKLSNEILTNFANDQRSIYKKMITEKNRGFLLYKIYGKKILKKQYIEYDFNKTIILNKFSFRRYNRLQNYTSKSTTKCISVFGKEQCNKEKREYVKIKNKLVLKSVVTDISKSRISLQDKILLVKRKNLSYYDSFFIIDSKQGVYGKVFLNFFKKSLDNSNYKFLLLLEESKIKTIKDAYKTNILNVYYKLFQEL